jgi:hypothetical protein
MNQDGIERSIQRKHTLILALTGALVAVDHRDEDGGFGRVPFPALGVLGHHLDEVDQIFAEQFFVAVQGREEVEGAVADAVVLQSNGGHAHVDGIAMELDAASANVGDIVQIALGRDPESDAAPGIGMIDESGAADLRAGAVDLRFNAEKLIGHLGIHTFWYRKLLANPAIFYPAFQLYLNHQKHKSFSFDPKESATTDLAPTGNPLRRIFDSINPQLQDAEEINMN